MSWKHKLQCPAYGDGKGDVLQSMRAVLVPSGRTFCRHGVPHTVVVEGCLETRSTGTAAESRPFWE